MRKLTEKNMITAAIVISLTKYQKWLYAIRRKFIKRSELDSKMMIKI